MTLIQPVRLSEKIKPLLDLKTKEEHISRSAILKQFVYGGLEEYALELCAKGRLSAGRAAEILGISIYDIQEMAKEKGIILSATGEAAEKREETGERLVKQLKKAG